MSDFEERTAKATELLRDMIDKPWSTRAADRIEIRTTLVNALDELVAGCHHRAQSELRKLERVAGPLTDAVRRVRDAIDAIQQPRVPVNA